MQNVAFKQVFLADYRPAIFQIKTIKLSFNIVSEEDVHVTNIMEVECQNNAGLEDGYESIYLNGCKNHITHNSLKVNGKELSACDYLVESDSLVIHRVPERFTLEIESGLNPKANDSCMGLYVSEGIEH